LGSTLSKLVDFLKLYNSRSPATKKTYRTAIKYFLEFIYPEPEQSVDYLSDRYFDDDRNNESDVKDYVVHLINQKTPKTVTTYITALRQFLIQNDVDFSTRFWKEVNLSRPRGKGARTRDRIPTTTELKHLLDHMPVRGKALFLLMATSGMRLNEALHLTLDDIHYSNGMNLIDIRHTKSGNPRDGFFTNEAKEYVELWMQNRNHYLKQAVARSRRFKKSLDDDRLFPFESMTAYKIWNGALEKTGLDEKDRETQYHVLRVHSLRKFTRTRLGHAGVVRDIIDSILGHEQGEDEAYARYTRQEKWDAHQSAWHELAIFGSPAELTDLDNQLQQHQTTIGVLTQRILRLENENRDVKQLQAQVTVLQAQLREIKESRKETDTLMNQLVSDPEFMTMLRKKLRELS
jgi:integrase